MRSFLLTCIIALLLGVGDAVADVQLQCVTIPENDPLAKKVDIAGYSAFQHKQWLAYRLPAGASFQGDGYVKVHYLDQGFGLLQVYYLDKGGSYMKTLRHTRSSRVNSGEWVDSFHRLPNTGFAGGELPELLIKLESADGGPLSVESVTLSSAPFSDTTFQKVISEAWKLPPSAKEASKDPAPKSLQNTVMVGYQGWFNTPNDLNDTGWFHWFKSQSRALPSLISVDIWPDTSAYPASAVAPAENMKTKSGKQAYLYSATSEEVIRQQMRWLKQYGVDGVFLERFGPPPPRAENQEWVLSAIRKSANAEGRTWALMYDIAAIQYDTGSQVVERFKQDWIRLVDEYRILDDKFYLRENGKPVILFWGLSYPGRKFTQKQADAIVDFVKNDPKYGGNYIIGGIPNWWRSMPDWYEHFRRYDCLMPWQGWQRTKEYTRDREAFAKWGISYYAHVWPGFSSFHRQGSPFAEWDRDEGRYFWKLMNQAIAEGNKALFIGMLDEVDEGTAVLPMSDDPPEIKPLLNDAATPPLWYLQLASHAKEILKGQRAVKDPMPNP